MDPKTYSSYHMVTSLQTNHYINLISTLISFWLVNWKQKKLEFHDQALAVISHRNQVKYIILYQIKQIIQNLIQNLTPSLCINPI